MTGGLPFDAWILLVVAVGAGLGLQLATWWAHRGSGGPGAPPGADGPDDGGGPGFQGPASSESTGPGSGR